MPTGAEPASGVRVLHMSDPQAAYSVVSGVLDVGNPEGDGYKWTTDSAQFEFMAGDLSHSSLYMHYIANGDTMRETGPLKISIDVDGKPFDSFVQADAGEHDYRHAAGAIATQPGKTLVVTVRIEPPFVAKGDGQKLGVLLQSIGFAD